MQDRYIGVRLSDVLVDAVDRYALRMEKEQPGATFRRSDALRMLLHKGLAEEGIEVGPEDAAE